MTSVTTEGIAMQTTGVHHVSLRSTDLARAKVFYIDRLGFPLLMESPNLLIFGAGPSAIAIDGPGDTTPSDDHFNPFRVGLDHLALGCSDARELRRVAAALTSAGIQNTGVKVDPTLNKEYVAFKDPDGISWEFYMV
jgi:catechol 2,3-dioxygenase-like lactoylglutathione lyase family enzyme